MHESDIVKAFRVSKGHKFKLADHDPGETLGLGIKTRARPRMCSNATPSG